MFKMISLIGILSMAVILLGIRLSAKSESTSAPRSKGKIEWIALLGTWVSFIYLVLSGYYAIYILDAPLTQYMLITHVTAGMVFAVSLLVLAVYRAESCRFFAADSTQYREIEKAKFSVVKYSTSHKLFFWLFLASGLCAAAAILLSMTPLFGTSWQDALLELHRWSALCAVLSAMGLVLSR